MANPQYTGLLPSHQNILAVAQGAQRIEVYLYGDDGTRTLP